MEDLNIFLSARLVKKVVAVLCRCVQGGGKESRNPSHNPTIYQSYPFATKHSSLLSANIFQREKTVWAALCLPPQGVA